MTAAVRTLGKDKSSMGWIIVGIVAASAAVFALARSTPDLVRYFRIRRM